MNNVIPFRAPVRKAGLPERFRVRPAGQAITWAPAGTTAVGVAFDAAGNSVSLDASNNPIRGTVFGPTDLANPIADSNWTGTGATTSGGGTIALNPNVVVQDAAAILGTTASTILGIVNGSDQNARNELAQQTQLQIAQLNAQANAATQAGNIAQANAARAQATQLAQFQAQAGLQQSSNTMTTVLIGVLGLALVGGLVYAVTRSDGSSARRSSARRNPSRGHRRGKRKHRRHRRAA